MDVGSVQFLSGPAGAAALDRAREVRSLPIHNRAKALAGLGDSHEIRAALQQDDLRQRAAERCPHADRLLFTPEALEQATAWPVAAERATRWPEPLTAPVSDLGAGIGLDGLAIALTGRPVVAYERDPVRALALVHNAYALGVDSHFEVRTQDVLTANAAGPSAYFDPDRREGGVRTRDPQAFAPAAGTWAALLSGFERAMIKLPPVTEGTLPLGGPIEHVSLGGRARECRLLVGDWPDAAPLRALSLPTGRFVQGEGIPRPAARAVEVGDWILDPDVSVTLAGLLGDLAERDGLAAAHPDINYLVAEAPNETAPGHFVRVDAILKVKPKLLNAWLKANDVGDLTIRKRGIDQKAEAWRKKLRVEGSQKATLVFTRALDDKWVVYAGLEER